MAVLTQRRHGLAGRRYGTLSKLPQNIWIRVTLNRRSLALQLDTPSLAIQLNQPVLTATADSPSLAVTMNQRAIAVTANIDLED